MRKGDRVLFKVTNEIGFVEDVNDGIVSCWMGVGPDRRLEEFPIEDLAIVGPTPQAVADGEYDPFKV